MKVPTEPLMYIIYIYIQYTSFVQYTSCQSVKYKDHGLPHQHGKISDPTKLAVGKITPNNCFLSSSGGVL